MTLSGTVNHGWGGWTDSQTNGFGDGVSNRPGSSSTGESGVGTAAPAVTTPDGYVIGAVVEVVDGPDAGRQATTDGNGRYVLESLRQAQFTIRATAEGFASVRGVVDLTADRVLDFAISQKPSAPQLPSPFPDTDPAWVRTLAADYPHAHQVANVRVFSDISPTFSREHAEHLKRVWDFFDALYVENRGDWIDVYYTTSEQVYLKLGELGPNCLYFNPDTRNTSACYPYHGTHWGYPRWFIIPYTFPDPDFGTHFARDRPRFPLRGMATGVDGLLPLPMVCRRYCDVLGGWCVHRRRLAQSLNAIPVVRQWLPGSGPSVSYPSTSCSASAMPFILILDQRTRSRACCSPIWRNVRQAFCML